ncbi:MAG: hypothetical protein JWP30_505 [Homoserinimonas sp.]|nr:hypothetical protein [Homoserinimonas sp.]
MSGKPQPRPRRSGRKACLSARGWFFLVVAGIAGVLAYVVGRSELLFIGCFLAGAPLSAWCVVRFRALSFDVRRSFSPRIVTVGHSTLVTLVIRNTRLRPSPEATWRDGSGLWASDEAGGSLPMLPGASPRLSDDRNSIQLSYELSAPRRGRYDIGPCVVRLSDPFALAAAELEVGEAHPIIVAPEAVALPDSGLAIADADGSARLVNQRATGGEHDITTRTYRTGDALRRVHWHASAHHGSLMVRQEEQRSHAEARILIDTRREGYSDFQATRHSDDPESTSFEWVVTFTAALAAHLERNGFQVAVAGTGGQSLGPVEHPAEFLESLATLTLTAKSSSVPVGELVRGSGRRAPGSVFVVVSDVDEATLGALISARATCALAVAFVVTSGGNGAAEALQRAGWTCVVVDPQDQVEDAWLALGKQGSGHDTF